MHSGEKRLAPFLCVELEHACTRSTYSGTKSLSLRVAPNETGCPTGKEEHAAQHKYI